MLSEEVEDISLVFRHQRHSAITHIVKLPAGIAVWEGLPQVSHSTAWHAAVHLHEPSRHTYLLRYVNVFAALGGDVEQRSVEKSERQFRLPRLQIVCVPRTPSSHRTSILRTHYC
ncbi:MAG: hypothetical protein MJZ29_11380 [Bacteroidaceae bacterium]|nr:hypothetical protein [Bacteroidaceae bacterium]